jgi:hypothetical protein
MFTEVSPTKSGLFIKNEITGGGAGIWPASGPERATIQRKLPLRKLPRSFTPDTADMSLNPENPKDGNIKEKFFL